MVKSKGGVTREKYKDVRSEPVVKPRAADYAGRYVYHDLGWWIDIQVTSDGKIEAIGYEEPSGSFKLENATISGGVLTATKVYQNGKSERFEGAFLNRTDRESPNDPGVTTFGLGVMLATPVEIPGATVDRLFYQAEASDIREELEQRYEENTAAFRRGDLAAVMALRAPDFHTITPDGTVRDRAAMENYTQGIMNSIKEWKSLSFTIDSLRVAGDTAFAIVSQHLDRMALRPDNQVHHVETWVTQREAWVRHGGRWLLWRVDQLRDQRRLVDGQPS